jgi:hypothetical protein
MALLSFRGISTPSLTAQGEQRRSSYFNIPRDNPPVPSNPPQLQLTPGHEYVLRDWVGLAHAAQWYKFQLDKPRLLKLSLYNLYLDANVIIEDERGTVFGVTSSNGISPIRNLLYQRFTGNLPAGTYYVHVNYESTKSPGTSFGLSVIAQ